MSSGLLQVIETDIFKYSSGLFCSVDNEEGKLKIKKKTVRDLQSALSQPVKIDVTNDERDLLSFVKSVGRSMIINFV